MNLDRSCFRDHIRRTLAERILTGVLKPGERLTESKLALEFNSSQTPVREALRELESLRLVESSPYRGTRVRDICDRASSEAYAIRGALEKFAAETAAVHLGGNVSELRKFTAAMIDAATHRDLDGYAKHDFEFHRAIIVASRNETLLPMWESLSFETRTRQKLAGWEGDLVAAARWHDVVVDALETGDGVSAGLMLENHARSFMVAIAKQCEEATRV